MWSNNEEKAYYRCRICGETSPLSETTCKRCGHNLLVDGDIVNPGKREFQEEPPTREEYFEEEEREEETSEVKKKGKKNKKKKKGEKKERKKEKREKRKDGNRNSKKLLIFGIFILIFALIFLSLIGLDYHYDNIKETTSNTTTTQSEISESTEPESDSDSITYSFNVSYEKAESDCGGNVPVNSSLYYIDDEIYISVQLEKNFFVKKAHFSIRKDGNEIRGIASETGGAISFINYMFSPTEAGEYSVMLKCEYYKGNDNNKISVFKSKEKTFKVIPKQNNEPNSSLIRAFVSYSNVDGFINGTDDPEEIRSCYENEDVYFNVQAARGIYLNKATYLVNKGDSEYDSGFYIPAAGEKYFNYHGSECSFPEGVYEIGWEIEFSRNEDMKNIEKMTVPKSTLTVKKPSIVASSNSVILDLDDNSGYSLNFTCDAPGIVHINYPNGECVEIVEDNWKDNVYTFYIYPKYVGTQDMCFILRNESDTVDLAQTTVKVVVTD